MLKFLTIIYFIVALNMHYFLFLYLLIFFCGCKQNTNNTQFKPKEVITDKEISVKVYSFNSLQPLLSLKDNKIHVINFWATWCKPCVAELPYFENLTTEYANKNIEVVLVSLDMPSQIKSKLIPFMRNKKLKSKVILLDDPDANEWIPKVSSKWSGAIPATLIYNKEKSEFYEQSFTYKTLTETLKNFEL